MSTHATRTEIANRRTVGGFLARTPTSRPLRLVASEMCANIGDGRVELRFDEAEGGGYISYALSDAERLDWRQIFNELGALGCQLVSYDLDEGYYTDENQICWGVVAA